MILIKLSLKMMNLRYLIQSSITLINKNILRSKLIKFSFYSVKKFITIQYIL